MKIGRFVKDTAFTTIGNLLTFGLGLGSSIVIARLLGPEGKGFYTMAVLLPSLVVTFSHLGIGPATVYYTARGPYSQKEIFSGNIILAFMIGGIGLIAGLIVIIFFRDVLFPNISFKYLSIALILVPVNLFFSYLRYILLGAQKIKEFNLITIFHSFLFLTFVALFLWGLRMEIVGALIAGILAWVLADVILFFWVRKAAGGILFKPNFTYFKDISTYGIKAHLANILGFLNYRVDMFLVNGLLNPAAVGFYSTSVGLVEKLWLISQAASTVLFPRIAAEIDEERRKLFTPLVARTVFCITVLSAGVLFLVTRYIIVMLYSEAFLPAVRPLQILLLGIVALSVWRLLANDLAGRGRPMLNTYITAVAVIVNVVLNLLLIPSHGIEGAAWASTASYGTALMIILIIYCRLSGNSWTKVLVPQRGDCALYWKTSTALGQWMRAKVGGL
ncbi:TPA: flippase [Candidatus Bathyarchaeota archaeon]|nr:flippase [Candidatus Bathyarchaeota archaeon]